MDNKELTGDIPIKINSELPGYDISDHRPNYGAEELQYMSDYLFRGLPHRIETIKMLLKTDDHIREICADYAEMTAWIEHHCRSENQPKEQCNYARQVIRELESELIRALEDSGY